ncbi:MAG: RICIN domain-containing protein, partial [[Clostridium] leptum]
MKKNAGFKATAVLLPFLLVLQISPITAWADELNSSASETVSSQLPSGEAEGGSASDFQEPGVSSEIPGTASSRENSSVEGTASSETASETVSEQESGPSSDTEASSQEASGSQAEASGPEKETTPESLEELAASVLVTNGNENPINEPDLASQYGYELPPAEEKETYEILGEDTSLREESIKYFRLKDGGYLAAGYPVPVHYEDKETGEFLEINNDLEKTAIDGETYYTNADNPFEVSLPENLSAGQPIIVSQDENSIGLTYLPNEDGHEEAAADSGILAARPQKPAASALAEGNIQITNRVGAAKTSAQPLTRAVTEEQRIEAANETMQKAEKVESKALYETEPNISFEYHVVGNYLKENIVIREKSVLEPFRFELDTNGMTAELQENRSVLIFNEAEEETAFLMNAPFMYDAAGARTSEVEVTLTETANGYLYTMTPSEEWLSDPARAYPVTIDPHIEKITSYANVKDTTVSFKTRGATVGASSLESSAEIAYLKVGRQYNGNELGAAVYFAVPSNIPKSARIVQATMDVAGYRGGLSTCPSDTQINAYRITSDWNVGNIKENKVLYTNSSPKTPSYDSAALDYFIYNDSAASSDGTWKEIDITRAVQEWVNGTPNYGILLRGVNLPSSGDRLARFYDSDNGVENSDPQYAFWYRDTSGLEDYWSYHSHSAGIAGNGYLNDFNGNLVFIHDDASTVSDLMPATVSHVYNSSASNEASRFGNGWRLNVMQTLEAVKSGSGVDPAQYPYVYTDGDGTKHYFYKDTKDGNKIKDEDGMGMEYSAYPNPTYDLKHQITLKDKTKLIFGTDSYLRRIIDTNGNTIQFQYGPRSDGNFLGYITDAVGNRIIMTYTSDYSKLTKITDESTGRVTSFQYDSAGNLTSITHSDGGKAVYTYFGKLLNSVTDPAGYGMRYYYLGNTFRVYKIQERYNGAVSQSMELDFSKVNQTTFTTHGMDGNYDTEGDNQVITYQFDNFGHPVAVQDQDGNANKYQYDTDDEKEPHKLMKASSMQKPVLNLLKDYGMDSDGTWKTVNQNDHGTITRMTNFGHLGNTSYKITKSEAEGSTAIYQTMNLPKGTYTASVYMRAENLVPVDGDIKGAGLWIGQKDVGTDYFRILTEDTDTDFDDGWVRITGTFTVAQDGTKVYFYAGIAHITGTVYIDSAQLETGEAANKLNLIKNSGFQSTTNGKLDHWSFSETPAGSGVGSPPSHTQAALINPTISGRPKFSQAINVQGKEGDVYSLSGWASTTGAKPGGEFRIAAAFIFDGAPAQWFTAPFNESVTGWQFANGIGVADDGDPTTTRTYSAIHVYVFYKDQLNPVYIDNLQLVKDNGHSYVYDDDGNVTSSADAAEDSKFNYDDHSNLKQMVDVSGNHFGYYYDSKENLTDARNSDGINYIFSYDSHGLPIASDMHRDSHHARIINGDDVRLRNGHSGKYMEIKGAIDADSTVVQQYPFNGGANQIWKLVKDKEGTYRIYTKLGSKTRVLDVKRLGTTDGTPIQIYTPNDSDGQRFILEYAGGDAYRIVPKHAPHMALAPTGGSQGNSIPVVLKTKNTAAKDQLWYFEDPGVMTSEAPKAGETFHIRNRMSGKNFDVNLALTADNTPLLQGIHNGRKNQTFLLESVPGQDGWYYLLPKHANGKALQVTDVLVNNAEKTVRLLPKSNVDRQKFSFTKLSDGTYKIVCKAFPNEFLAIAANSYDQSAHIVSTTNSSDSSNRWILEKTLSISSSASYTSDGRHISSVTDSRGTKTSYTYDSKNRMNTGVTI